MSELELLLLENIPIKYLNVQQRISVIIYLTRRIHDINKINIYQVSPGYMNMMYGLFVNGNLVTIMSRQNDVRVNVAGTTLFVRRNGVVVGTNPESWNSRAMAFFEKVFGPC